MFQREVEKAERRAGGERALEQRAVETVTTRRDARRAAFRRYRDKSAGPAPDARSVSPTARSAERRGLPDDAQPASANDSVPALPTRSIVDPPPQPQTDAPSAASANGASELLDSPTLARTTTSVRASLGAGRGPGTASAPPAVASNPARNPAITTLPRELGTRPVRPPQGLPSAPVADPVEMQRAIEVLEQLRVRVSPGLRRMTIDLVPAELGRLSVHVALRAGRVAATISADTQQTLALLEHKLPELLASFQEQGIEAETIELRLGFGAEENTDGKGTRGTQAARADTGARSSVATPAPDEQPTPRPSRSTTEGNLDTYA